MQHSGIILVLHCTSETVREAIFNVTTKKKETERREDGKGRVWKGKEKK